MKRFILIQHNCFPDEGECYVRFGAICNSIEEAEEFEAANPYDSFERFEIEDRLVEQIKQSGVKINND